MKKLGQYKEFVAHAEQIKALQSVRKESEDVEEINLQIEDLRSKLQTRMDYWKGQLGG